jgi:hypothetical protein
LKKGRQEDWWVIYNICLKGERSRFEGIGKNQTDLIIAEIICSWRKSNACLRDVAKLDKIGKIGAIAKVQRDCCEIIVLIAKRRNSYFETFSRHYVNIWE